MLFIILCFVFVSVAIFSFAGFKIFRKSYALYEERYISRAAGTLDEMFVFLPPEQILYLTFLSTFLGSLLGLAVSIMAPWVIKLIVVPVLGGLGFFTPRLILKRMLKKRLGKFNDQLVDGLTIISNGLKAGFSLLQALDILVKEMKPPISQEFGLLLREHKMGESLETALENLTKRVKSEDLDLVVTTVLTTRQIGGNVAEIFDRISDTIRQRNQLYGKINALTAQGKLQGIIVGLLPLFLGMIMYKIDPNLMRPLFTEPLGWLAIGLVVVLEAIGAFLIKKIVTIDV